MADSDASTPANRTIAERPSAADGVGSVSRHDNSGKREDLELRSATRRKRVISVSGSLLGVGQLVGADKDKLKMMQKRSAKSYSPQLGIPRVSELNVLSMLLRLISLLWVSQHRNSPSLPHLAVHFKESTPALPRSASGLQRQPIPGGPQQESLTRSLASQEGHSPSTQDRSLRSGPRCRPRTEL